MLPVTQKAQSQTDVEHLNVLKIGYYANAVLAALFSCIFVLNIVMGFMIPTSGIGWLCSVIGLVSLLTGWAYAALNFYIAGCLEQRKRRSLILLTAGINCCNFPLGVLLGVFTFIVMSRPTVRLVFEGPVLPAGSLQGAALSELSKDADPDEEIWREIEEKARKNDSVRIKLEEIKEQVSAVPENGNVGTSQQESSGQVDWEV